MSDRPDNHSAKDASSGRKPSCDVFVSYARADAEVAQTLAKKLRDRGVSTWEDTERMLPGEQWDRRLREAIDRSRLCLVLVSEKTSPPAPWVSKEWATIQDSAWRRSDLSVCPVLLDDVAVPTFLRRWQGIRLSRKNVEEAVADIVDIVRRSPAERVREPSEDDLSDTAARFSEIAQTLQESKKAERKE